MKKYIRQLLAVLLAGALMLAAAGCTTAAEKPDTAAAAAVAGQPAETAKPDEPATGEPEPETTNAQPEEETSGSGTLVIYFSRTGEQYSVGVIEKGNTAIVAEMIAERTGADLFEILPADDHYPMTYNELTDVAKREQKDNARPAYAGEVPDLSRYGTIFIGAPVWWGDWPMILYTFFESNADALSGKTLIPFSTHAGSGLSGFDRKLSATLPDSTVGKGLAIAGTDAQYNPGTVREDVNSWLSALGY